MRAALLALVACGGAASTGPARPKQEAIDPEVATKGATDLVQELYEDVGHGNTDSLQSLLDPKLMVLGPRRGDAVANRSDAILALSKWADSKRKLKPTLKSGALGVYPSSGGHSAWGCDTLDANDHHWAVMVVMSGNNDLWSLDGVMLGETPTEPDLKAALKKEAAVPPAAGVTIKADPEIALIVERFTKGLGDPQAFAADMASSDDAIVIGPAKGEIAKGKAAVAAYWKKRIKISRSAVAGEISGASTKDGMLAWVSAPIVRADEGEDALPLRAFAVFRRSGDAWKLIGLQEAVALDAPGAGAPFKKFAPAQVKEAPPPADDEEKPTKKVATKAKKKPVDEEKPAKKVATKKKAASDDDEVKPVAKKKKKPADDEDDAPKKKVAAKKKPSDDDDEDKPVVKKKKPASDDDDDAPKKKVAAKKKPASDDDDDDAPKKKPVAKHAAGDDDDTDADKQTRKHHGFGGGADDNDVPSKRFKKKKPAASDDDDDKPVAKKKKPAADDDDDEDAPKKKKKKPADDDE